MRLLRRVLAGALLLLGAQCWAQDPVPAAQTAPDNTAPAQNGPTPQYTNVDQPQSLNFLGEAAANSNLRLGIIGGYLYQGTSSGSSEPALNSLLIGPSIGITSIHSKWSLALTYNGLLTSDPAQTNRSYYSQNAGADVLYQLSPHWQAHAADHYIYTANPFESYFSSSGPPLPNEPNPTVYFPTLRTEQNTATLDLSDRLTRADTLTLNGNTYFRRYESYINTAVPFYNVTSYGGGANYVHQFSARLSLGGGYSFSSLDFAHGYQRTGVNQMQAIVTYVVSPSLTVSGYFGPEYVTARDTFQFFGFFFVLHQSSWTPAGGVTVTWKDARNSVLGTFSRQTTDGGGILATTNANVFKLAYMRQVTAKWTATIGTQYSNNVSFVTGQTQQQVPNRSYTYWNSQVQGTRKLSNSMSLNVHYAYLHTNYDNIYVTGSRTFDYSAAGATINYYWNHPLGR